jgi:drug/metabolite transporter (DMT)-like permease
MSGVFIAMGRAVVAAALSAAFLLATRAPWPRRQDWLALAITSAGVVFGFPLLSSVAMRYVEAVHASVIIGVLPLATAAVGAWLHNQRPSAAFWCCAAMGSALVVGYAILRSGGLGFALAVIAVVFIGRRMPVKPAADATLAWRTP